VKAIVGDLSTQSQLAPGSSEEPHRYPDIYADLEPIGDPPDFPMFGVHRDVVTRLLTDNNVDLVLAEHDERCGPEWVGYRYFVTKRPGSHGVDLGGGNVALQASNFSTFLRK
jgi:hypothetical protein